MSRSKRLSGIVIAGGWAIGILSAGCRSDGSSGSTAEPVYSILQNGAHAVAHSGVENIPRYRLTEDVRIGAIDGPDEFIFGEIRAVAVDANDRIHILDFQTQLIRTFSPQGGFVRTTARRGGGPAEIEDANGVMVDRAGTLWVNDPGNGRVIAIDSTGVQLASYLRQVSQYGFIWNGGADSTGWVWDLITHYAPDEVRPSPGVHEFQFRIYGKGFDTQETSRVDSVLLADTKTASVAFPRGNARIPFLPRYLAVFDNTGGFWLTGGGTYEVVHITVTGDTTLVITNRVAPVPVTETQRSDAIAGLEEWKRQAGPADIDWSVIPEAHPTIIQLIPELSGEVWVRRPTADGTFVADRYAASGAYEGTVTSALNISQHHRLVATRDVLHVVTTDSLGVQYVVKARVVSDKPLGFRQ